LEIADELRSYWDEDAVTYNSAANLAAGHFITSPAERAAWTRVFESQLPRPPARLLDVGAGTGFLSLMLARLGYSVTALDISSGMLEKLEESARLQGLEIETVQGTADSPPDGTFDGVVERLLLWTLPDPGLALERWREACPSGRLLCIEGIWGAADPLERPRERLRQRLRRWRRQPTEHHGSYSRELNRALPLTGRTSPERVVEAVEGSAWGPASLERLRDVEWAILMALDPVERMLGVPGQFLVSAGQLSG
jgi:SAM-dependent methyltransferase